MVNEKGTNNYNYYKENIIFTTIKYYKLGGRYCDRVPLVKVTR